MLINGEGNVQHIGKLFEDEHRNLILGFGNYRLLIYYVDRFRLEVSMSEEKYSDFRHTIEPKPGRGIPYEGTNVNLPENTYGIRISKIVLVKNTLRIDVEKGMERECDNLADLLIELNS